MDDGAHFLLITTPQYPINPLPHLKASVALHLTLPALQLTAATDNSSLEFESMCRKLVEPPAELRLLLPTYRGYISYRLCKHVPIMHT